MEVGLSVSSGQKKTGEKVLLNREISLIEADAQNQLEEISPRLFDMSSLYGTLDAELTILNNILYGGLINDASPIELIFGTTFVFGVKGSDNTYSVYYNTKRINLYSDDLNYLSDIFILNPENKIRDINIHNSNNTFSVQRVATRYFNINNNIYIIGDKYYTKCGVLRVIQNENTSNYIDIIFNDNLFFPSYVDCRHSAFYDIIKTYPFAGFKIQAMIYTYEYTPYENEITPDQ